LPEAAVLLAALRSAASGIVITATDGTIVWVNPAACRITGYTAEELAGRHTRLLKSGQHDPAFYAALWQTVLAGRTWSGTIVNRRKDGTLYDEEQTIAPIQDTGGRITYFVAVKQDVTERRQLERELRRAHEELAGRMAEIEALNGLLRDEAVRDPLTQLYNRRFLDEALPREAARDAAAGRPLSVAAIDIDRFKRVNDALGHAVGDRVLRQLADVLRANVRKSDLICRVGGDEFVVVMPGADLAVAVERTERWRAAFAVASDESLGALLRCTVSIGVTEHRGEAVQQTLERADAALYAAKRAGRDRVRSVAAPGPTGRG